MAEGEIFTEKHLTFQAVYHTMLLHCFKVSPVFFLLIFFEAFTIIFLTIKMFYVFGNVEIFTEN